LTSPFRGTEGWERQVEKNLFAEASETTCLVEENSFGETSETAECPHCLESGLTITDVIAPATSRYSPQSAAPREGVMEFAAM
jgi:hypothetical protein